MNERKLISTIIKIGSYTGIAMIGAAVLIQLSGKVLSSQFDTIFNLSVHAAIIILIFTPVTAMYASALYFFYKKEWKWMLVSAGLGTVIVISFIAGRGRR